MRNSLRFFIKPHGASAENKVPAVVLVHGGPGGQARTGYNASAQYLANHGYVVLDVNNRGSSGYGKTFYAADDRKHGREPLWDCVEAKKYFSSLAYVDREQDRHHGRILRRLHGAGARSPLSRRSSPLGVDIFGVSNWVRTLESIPPYWESQRKSLYAEIGDPETQLEMLRDTSPLFHADKITKPLIVLARRERSARDQAGIGRNRRSDQEKERRGRIRRLRQRRPRLHQEGE